MMFPQDFAAAENESNFAIALARSALKAINNIANLPFFGMGTGNIRTLKQKFEVKA